MDDDRLNTTGISDNQSETKSDRSKISDHRMNLVLKYNDNFMSLLADATKARYSFRQLSNLLDGPEWELKRLWEANPKFIRMAMRSIRTRFPYYPNISIGARDVVIDWAEHTQRRDTRRLLQLAVLWHAVSWYSKLRESVPIDRLALQCIQEQFISACWWTALWEDLVQAHGDQLPTFFLFE